jgi:hypothetical protein
LQNIKEEIANDNSFNIIKILFIDHSCLKECISIINNDINDFQKRSFYLNNFLKTLKIYIKAKVSTVYDSINEMDEFRKHIIKAEIECVVMVRKYKKLLPRIIELKSFDNKTMSEIKVLVNLVKQHIEETEQELFLKLRTNLASKILNEIGFQYMIMRRFSQKDLEKFPNLQKEIYVPSLNKAHVSKKKHINHHSAIFVKKVNKYINSLVGQFNYF